MTLRHIHIFLAVCNHNCNTTHAAQALLMTQPAVSLAIRELEQHYGIQLFDRIGRRLYLSEAGKKYREYASHINMLFEDMEKSMLDWDHFGLLRVGASITIGSQFLPSYIESFSHLHPGIKIQAVVSQSHQLEEKILNNELDIALIEGTAHSPALICEEYMEDHLTVICPADGTFTSGQTLSLDCFRQQHFLLREPGSGTREVFDRTIEHAGFSITPLWEAMSTTALVNAVIHGLGIAVLPHRMVVGPMERGLVIPVTVEGLQFQRRFHIIYHREKYLTKAAQAFLDLCRNYEMDYPLPKYNGLY